MATANTKRIMVCSECLRAACYYGEFMCDGAIGAGTVIKTVGELRPLDLEHPDYWGVKAMIRIYGQSDPFARSALSEQGTET